MKYVFDPIENTMTPYDKDEACQHGKQLAWETAARIYDIACTDTDLKLFPGRTSKNIFMDVDVDEAIERLEELDREWYCHCGDEVAYLDGTRAVIIDDQGEGHYILLTENGCVDRCHISSFNKTGRNFPQIQDVIELMQKERT